ncbi:alcohol dehydrogenase catalytic domain-containing protein [Glutamicibacter sp.]|uniref:alcohol dehydrogenase catalytic domain-containing protein n=1 Tax=Glutamicibacter sp. TaxID=1931995 RepID=UPI0028BE803B|nr:alcohol dehydrogenase catalytic domain-containing protein [Glutamicibacter sp.]
MRANYMLGNQKVELREVPDPVLIEPTDALVEITASCICGSDLHSYHGPEITGRPIGHEFVGRVTEVGSEVSTVAPGDFVIAPFTISCGECEFCREGLYTSCLRLGWWGSSNSRDAACQAEAIRVPLADGTLVKVDAQVDDALLPSLLTLSDVYATGFHAAAKAQVGAGDTVAVIGDGAVGLLAVLSAQQLGAERIILMGRHEARTELGREFGATEVVSERGEEGIAKVRELTGYGAPKVLEAVGLMPAFEQAIGIVRPGGVISRVGVPQYQTGPVGRQFFGPNVTLTGGVAPVRGYIERLLPGVLEGHVNPGKVFDSVLPLAQVAQGYAAMEARTSLKVMLRG